MIDNKKYLSNEKIADGWKDTFSTNNPFCPCDFRSFSKAVLWAERTIILNQSTQLGEVRDAALEEAAIECDRQGYEESDCPERAAYCAEAIRQMKSTSAQGGDK